MDYEDEASVDNDLFLDTAGHCFLCLEKVRKIPGDSQNVHLSATFFDKKVYSFQYPSHYLKIDKTKVFPEAAHIPPYLLKKVRTSELKLELCDECADVSKKFSKMCQELERLRMEVATCVRNFMDKIAKSEDSAKNLSEGSGLSLQNVNIAQRVRAETLDKCKLSLKLEVPQVKLKRISASEMVQSGQNNSKNAFRTIPENHSYEEEHYEESTDFGDEISSHVPPSFSPAPSSPQMEKEMKPVIEASSTSPRIIKLRIIKKRKILQRKTAKLPCPRCDRTFAEKFALRFHLQNEHNLTDVGAALHYRCNLCGNFYPTKNKLYVHKRQVHIYKFKIGPGQFKCPNCEQKFTEAPFLLKHQETYHSLVFEDEHVIVKNMKVCEYTPRPSQFVCKLCANFYFRQGALTAHLRSSHGYKFKVAPGRFKCPGCQGDFNNLSKFLEHQEKEHPWKNEKENGMAVRVKKEITLENNLSIEQDDNDG